jgi:hypothetical protein
LAVDILTATTSIAKKDRLTAGLARVFSAREEAIRTQRQRQQHVLPDGTAHVLKQDQSDQHTGATANDAVRMPPWMLQPDDQGGIDGKDGAMEVKAIHISRRQMLLRGAAIFAGTAVLGVRQPALAKAAKSAFLYQDLPHEGQKCADCKHFSPGGSGGVTGTCAIVEGTVSANGWCQLFSPKA